MDKVVESDSASDSVAASNEEGQANSLTDRGDDMNTMKKILSEHYMNSQPSVRPTMELQHGVNLHNTYERRAEEVLENVIEDAKESAAPESIEVMLNLDKADEHKEESSRGVRRRQASFNHATNTSRE